jgi:octaprenyl-diphosphate synthase
MQSQYTRFFEQIEGELARTIPARPDQAWFRRFFGDLPGSFFPGPEIVSALNAPAIELVRRGGKRWRPLVLEAAARAWGREDGAISLTPLVELAHSGSLIVDDIEDGAEKRRGGRAIHLMFGVDAAVNDGNLLYFLPLALIDEFDAPLPVRYALHARYALHMRRLHLGQAMDIEWHRRDDAMPGEADYLAMCALKTGVLARASAELGALAAGAPEAAASALGGVFESVGVAFQILDDAKNLRSGLPGKDRGDDIVEGKKSLPVILACAAEPRLLGELGRCFAAARARGVAAPEVEEAIGILERSGAISASLSRARRMLDAAHGDLARIMPDAPRRAGLEGIFALLDA